MVDWSASMQQTFEFYEVDPGTWRDLRRIATIKKCNISRDADMDTLGSASFEVTDMIGECYIRVYLITVQNGVTEKHPLGTFLAQTPSSNYDGKLKSASVDAYTPLIELKENSPEIGFFINKGKDVMEYAHDLADENSRAPVIGVVKPSTTLTSHFVADANDNWLTFLRDLISAATVPKFYKAIKREDGSYYKTTQLMDYPYEYMSDPDETKLPELLKETITDENRNELPLYKYTDENGEEAYFCTASGSVIQYTFDLDEMGRIMFRPVLEAKSMNPVWTYTDDNSSILLPEVSMQHDLYGIPNVVKVVWSGMDSSERAVYREAIARNDDQNSPTSTVARGREIVHRVVNPDIHGEPTQEVLDKYAEQLLSAMSSVEYTISYTHGYCPVRLFDCVRLNYTRAGLTNIKAKVVRQDIRCETGCVVSETAVFTKKLWR